MATVRDVLAAATPRLERAGVETPRLDAELLLSHVLERNRTFLIGHPDCPLSLAQHLALEALLQRREQREPLPYLLGCWEFLALPFRVTRAVLIPRPETECLVEAALARLPDDAKVLDVGAGSGCISIGIAYHRRQTQVLALEPSPEAAEVARANAAELDCADRVRVIEGRFPEDARGLGPLDAVVSNPPYIASAEVARLPPELRNFEPRLALDGGSDGLDVLRPLAEESSALLKEGGFLAVEVALGQAERVAGLLRAAGCWNEPEILPDLGGIPRVVLAHRR